MIKNLDYYQRKFSPKSKTNKTGLNVSRSSGVAPNKPALLLCVIELMNRGDIKTNQIYLSPELIATFLKLWSDLEIERNPNIGMPFFYLRSDGFWHHRPNPGFEAVVASKVKLRTVNALKQAVEYAFLDRELFTLLQNSTTRAQLTLVLIESWFADKTEQIMRSLEFNAFADLCDRLLATGGRVYQEEEISAEDEQDSILRDRAFRRIVTSIYDYRCAFCGLQIFSSTGQNIVDGSHIKPFSQFYDDQINNGLSLCKNHHWAFDRFWFTINPDYTILVDENLREDSPHAKPMREFQGQQLLLPANEQYHPREDAINWHRQTFFERIA